MFEQLRKKKRASSLNFKAITAWALFGAIILVFVFLDMNPRNDGVSEGGAAAQVNRTVISMAEVAELAENQRRNNPSAETQRQTLQAQVLDQLISREVLLQEAEKAGLVVTDKQIGDVILNEKYFQENGRFKRERYMGYLQATRKTAAEFEDQVRRDGVQQRAVRLLSMAVKPSKFEMDRQKEVQDMKADTEFASIPTEEVVKSPAISVADVIAFLRGDGEKKANEYYESKKVSEFTKPEEVNARHILIAAKKGDSAAEEKAKEKIKTIEERLKKEDFGKVAKELSEDPGSKDKGGELGFFSQGKMVREFEAAAFSLKPNEVSQPIQTDYGFHIIQVLEKRPAEIKTFEQSRDGIARKLLAAERSAKALDEVRELVKKGDMNAVNQWIQKSGYKWEETGPFSVDTENIPKIGPNSEYADVAFTLSAAKPLADRLIRQGSQTYIVRHKAVPQTAKDLKIVKQSSKAGLMGAGNEFGEDSMSEMMNTFMARRRTEEAYMRWVKRLRDDAKISLAPGFAGAPATSTQQ